MDNIKYVRINKMKQRYSDVMTAHTFCKNNASKFKGKIHGPVALAINVKDNRYNALVEHSFGGARSSVFRVSYKNLQ